MPALDRLTAHDFYRQLDWLRDEWGDDEVKVARKILRLEQTCAQLPAAYYERTHAPIALIKRARIVNGVDWRGALLALGGIVSDWERSRPALIACPDCGATVRAGAGLANHRYIFHDASPGQAVSSG